MKYLIGRTSGSGAYLLLTKIGTFMKEKYVGFAAKPAAYHSTPPMVYDCKEEAVEAIPLMAEDGCHEVELTPELFERLGGTDLR